MSTQKYIPLSKRTKKEQKEINSKSRVRALFNTGTRTHQTDKHPTRARAKVLSMKGEE